jgi:hypothetical protein
MADHTTAGIDLDKLEALVREYGNTPVLSIGRGRSDILAEIKELARRSTSGSNKMWAQEELDRAERSIDLMQSDEASGSDGTATVGAGRLPVTEAMIDAYLAFTERAAYLNHPEVPYHGTANGDSEELWTRRMAAAAIRAALAQQAGSPVNFVRAGWFLYEGIEWVATSSDDPRATVLYRCTSAENVAAPAPAAQSEQDAREFVTAIAHNYDVYDEGDDERYCRGCSALVAQDGATKHQPDCIVPRAQAWLAAMSQSKTQGAA